MRGGLQFSSITADSFIFEPLLRFFSGAGYHLPRKHATHARTDYIGVIYIGQRIAHNHSIQAGGIGSTKDCAQIAGFLHRFKDHHQWVGTQFYLADFQPAWLKQCNTAIGAFAVGQFFKYGIAGFLQWGYNFWNTHLSVHPLDPWRDTDGDSAFPAGDAFSVYPGKDGPILSLHYLHFYEALCDLRAFEAAAAKVGKERVLQLIDPDGALTFEQYPRTDEAVLGLRDKINQVFREDG